VRLPLSLNGIGGFFPSVGTETPHELIANVSDTCAGENQRFTLESLAIDVVSAE
jgi:hypothetical protein